MTFVRSTFWIAIVLVFSSEARAAVLLNQAQFSAAVGGSAVVEDFEGFDTTILHPSPFVFANGRITTIGDLNIVEDPVTFGPTKRLVSAGLITAVKTFDAFPVGSTLVGMDIFYINSADTFNVLAEGGSGTLNITQLGSTLGTFLGFQDPLGITSIAFTNLGRQASGGSAWGNFTFDNIQTASAVIPEPTSIVIWSLLIVGVIAWRKHWGS